MDVLVLIEITAAAVQRLRVVGLDTLLPESVGQPSQGAGGTIIRSRIPMALVQARLDQVSAQSFLEPVVSIHSPHRRCRAARGSLLATGLLGSGGLEVQSGRSAGMA